jgi:hypothetical protein
MLSLGIHSSAANKQRMGELRAQPLSADSVLRPPFRYLRRKVASLQQGATMHGWHNRRQRANRQAKRKFAGLTSRHLLPLAC